MREGFVDIILHSPAANDDCLFEQYRRDYSYSDRGYVGFTKEFIDNTDQRTFLNRRKEGHLRIIKKSKTRRLTL